MSHTQAKNKKFKIAAIILMYLHVVMFVGTEKPIYGFNVVAISVLLILVIANEVRTEGKI